MPRLFALRRIAAILAAPFFALPTAALGQHQPGQQLFDFHNSMWINLHHFLYVTARSRLGLDLGRPAATSAARDTAGMAALPADERAMWDEAVRYYERQIAKRDILFDSGLVALNIRLSDLDDSESPRAALRDSALAEVLERAAPVYRAVWWPRHRAANAHWIATAMPLLAAFGDSAAAIETRVVQEPWSRTPIRVDVTAYANWAGAYTTTGPAHITIASTDPAGAGHYEFETLFHEVLHTMDDSLSAAACAAFRSVRKRCPHDPTHPFIFYTAGDVTRRFFPGHVPYAEANGLWSRVPDFAHALPLLRRYWQPYLDGRTSLSEALLEIATAW